MQAHAELQYWVSVGSYDTPTGAQSALERIGQRWSEPLTVIGAATNKGYYYRIATGPFLTRPLAEDTVRAAQAAGLDGAWIWVDEREGILGGGGSVRTPVLSDEFDYTADSSLDLALPASDPYLDVPPREPLEEEALMEREVPTLVEVAPDGYELNKLHREGAR